MIADELTDGRKLMETSFAGPSEEHHEITDEILQQEKEGWRFFEQRQKEVDAYTV